MPAATAIAPLGLTRSATHQYTWRDETGEYGPYPGVTSIIKHAEAERFGLDWWLKNQVAKAAVRNAALLPQLIETGGVKAAEDWLTTIPGYERDKTADLGTRVHALAEEMGRGGAITTNEDEAPYITQYVRFLDERKPEFLLVEFMVFSLSQQYGGTADALLRIDGQNWLVDYKTGRNTYAHTALQLAGLAGAAFIGEPGNPSPIERPRIDRYGVLHLRPDAWRLVEYHVGPHEWAAFRACRALYGWNETRAKEVM